MTLGATGPRSILPDNSRGALGDSPNACRLPNADVKLHHLLPCQPAELGRCCESGRLRVRVLRPDVPERLRGGRGIEVPRSPRFLPPRRLDDLEDGVLFAPAGCPSDSRLDQICPRTPASVRSDRSPTARTMGHHGPGVVAEFPGLSTTRRVQFPGPPPASGARAVSREPIPILGAVVVSGRPQLHEPSWQDGTLGRGDIARPRPVARPPAPTSSLATAGDPSGLLWPFSGEELSATSKRIRKCLGLDHLDQSLYCLRHGGASEDLLGHLRSVAAVKRRGRWRSDSPLRRYGKETRLQSVLNSVSPKVLQFGLRMDSRIAGCLLKLATVPALPSQSALDCSLSLRGSVP